LAHRKLFGSGLRHQRAAPVEADRADGGAKRRDDRSHRTLARVEDAESQRVAARPPDTKSGVLRPYFVVLTSICRSRPFSTNSSPAEPSERPRASRWRELVEKDRRS